MDAKIQDDLIRELGLDNLPVDKQDEIVIKMTEVILKRMFVETMDRLNGRDQELLGDMMETQADPDKIEEFLRDKISNYEELLQDIINKLKEGMKSMQT